MRLRRSKALAATLLTVTLAASISACASEDNSNDGPKTWKFYAPGGQTLVTYDEADRAPVKNFAGPSLMEPDTTISLSDFDGEVVVLNAWGQWCAPCRTETDDLQEVQEAIQPRGGTVLGINVRDYNEQAPQDGVRDNGLTYPSIYDPPFKTAAALGGVPASVVPTTIILDRQHRPAAVFLREVTAKEVLDVVEPLL